MKRITFERGMLLFEKVFFFFCVVHYSAAIIPPIITRGFSEGNEIPLTSFNWAPSVYLYFLTYIVAFLLLAFRWKQVLSSLKVRDFFLPFLVFFALVTALWSINPDRTFSAAIALLGNCFLSLYIASRYTLREQLRLLCWSFVVLLTLSILLVALIPSYGIEQGVHAGAIRGVFMHKNTFGKFLVLTVSTFLTVLIAEKSKDVGVFRVGLLMSGILLPLTRSSSAILNSCLIVVIALLLYRVLQFKTKLLIPCVILIFLSAGAFSFMAYGAAESVASAFGKDLTLTGRTDIWEIVIEKIQERPLQGYGFGAFWAQSPRIILRTFGWLAPNSHNGFLDLALDLGVVGLLLYFLSFLRVLGKSFLLTRKPYIDINSFWPFIFFLFTLLTNLTEGGLFGRNNIYSLLFINLYCSFFFFPKGPIKLRPYSSSYRLSKPRLESNPLG